MAKLLDQESAIELLKEHGWQRGKPGRHVVKMVKKGVRPITLPHHRGQVYGKRLTHAIIRQAELQPTEDGRWSSRSSYIESQMASGRRWTSSRGASRQAER